MNNTDFTLFFIFMALFNTNLGLSNIDKNNAQYKRQERIEEKLDKILELLNDRR